MGLARPRTEAMAPTAASVLTACLANRVKPRSAGDVHPAVGSPYAGRLVPWAT
ncbi:putative lipoprotein [Mycobacterium kansasii]|uniref:Putative lipoprotein n=1 Tax=Mycobacterium kansasii TaxID=1768 RepID=A0A1V3XU50_MYCKA|nr:putative lipoprotein [Mycobacterium kansasii]